MGALSDLLHIANHANSANGPTSLGRDSHDSHDSQLHRSDAALSDSQDSQHSHADPQLREALQKAAAIEGLPPDLVNELDDVDISACVGASLDELRVFLRALARTQRIAAGGVPEGWTHAASCADCGPVLLWKDAPASVIACPWCWHRKAGRTIPRPPGE